MPNFLTIENKSEKSKEIIGNISKKITIDMIIYFGTLVSSYYLYLNFEEIRTPTYIITATNTACYITSALHQLLGSTKNVKSLYLERIPRLVEKTGSLGYLVLTLGLILGLGHCTSNLKNKTDSNSKLEQKVNQTDCTY